MGVPVSTDRSASAPRPDVAAGRRARLRPAPVRAAALLRRAAGLAAFIAALYGATLLGPIRSDAAATPLSASSPRAPAEARSAGPQLSALDAAARAARAEAHGDRPGAVESWERAATLDPESLAPRLALARLLLFSDPPRAAEALREATEIALRDYRASRWLAGCVILCLALAGTLASLLLLLGLLLRHGRAMLHLLSETLAWSLRTRGASPWLALALLLLPLAAGFGWLGALVFWVFAASFRFQRAERLCALGVGAWLIMVGPVLEACRPLWALDPEGRDGALVYEAQRDPTSEANRAFVAAWKRDDPDAEVPRLLLALDQLQARRLSEAEASLVEAGSATTLPPAVIENNLGAVRALRGDASGALRHLLRAAAHDPGLFEPKYNLGLVLATEGRYIEADSAFDRAAAASLDRLRALGRVAAGDGPRPPAPALLSSADLWDFDLRHPRDGAAPALLVSLLPLRSLLWSAPVFLLLAGLGVLAAPRLRRLLAVHVCFQCGSPICRRCLVRVDRHAYCARCGETLASAGFGESTRILIQKLLEDRPSAAARVWPIASQIVPGVGAAARGYALPAMLSASLCGLALALLAWGRWAPPLAPLPFDPAAAGLAGALGFLAGLLAVLVNSIGVRTAQRRERGLRAFFERDVDRRAA